MQGLLTWVLFELCCQADTVNQIYTAFEVHIKREYIGKPSTSVFATSLHSYWSMSKLLHIRAPQIWPSLVHLVSVTEFRLCLESSAEGPPMPTVETQKKCILFSYTPFGPLSVLWFYDPCTPCRSAFFLSHWLAPLGGRRCLIDVVCDLVNNWTFLIIVIKGAIYCGNTHVGRWSVVNVKPITNWAVINTVGHLIHFMVMWHAK